VSAKEALIMRLQAVANQRPDYTVGGVGAQVWLADIDKVVEEAIVGERKRIISELGKHVSRYSSPIFAHLDSYGVGQVVQGKPWPEDQ
jgi:hypothetical protein